jgi:DNA-binding NarL/FixJ family response regulator
MGRKKLADRLAPSVGSGEIEFEGNNMETSVRDSTRARRVAIPEHPSIRSSDKATIVVIDERVLPRDCLVKCLRMATQSHLVLAFSSLAEWQEVEKNHPPAAVIMFCSHRHNRTDVEIESDLPFVSHDGIVIPVVIISEKEDADHVLAALERGARGYIPTSLTLDVAVGAMQFVEAGGTFVPASTLTSWKHTNETALAQDGPLRRLFTTRQAAVLECLRKGKANKQIAYELSMSEGTVKVHVRNIMKKLKVHNRTEAAVLVSTLFDDRDVD